MEMARTPLMDDEASRLAALRDLGVLDSPPEAEFDALVQVASLTCEVPVALISLVDAERQWFKANIGLPGVPETPRDVAFCAHTIHEGDLLEIHDALADPRFVANPLVTGEPQIRFYAGAPIRLGDGSAVGSLSVIDRRPRRLDDRQRETLRCLASSAAAALENWRARRLAQQVTQQLLASEDRLRRLYETTPALLHSIDPQGRLLQVSDAWLTRFGYTRPEVLGRPTSDFIHLPDGARLDTLLPEFLRRGAAHQIECRMRCRDGTMVEVLLSATLERDADGTPVHSMSVLEDLTSRRTAERALAAERLRLEHIIEGTGVGTWELNVRTGDLRIDERTAALLGRSLAELTPLTLARWRENFHPDDIARSKAVIAAHLAGTAEQYECDARLRHRDGEWRWVLARGRAMTRGADGQAESMFGIMLDITARKRQEEALRKSESFLERSGAIAGIGGWEVDLATGEITFSEQTCAIYGVQPPWSPSLDEAISYYPPEHRPTVEQAVAHAAATGEEWDLELPFIRADGRRIWVRTVGSVAFAEGRATRLFGAFQDVTARVEERLALREANQRIALATDSGRIGIWTWDLVDDTLHWDDWVYRLHDIDPADGPATFPGWVARLHPDERDATPQTVRDCLAGGRRLDIEYRVVWRDEGVHHLRAAGRINCDPTGRPVRVVGVTWDITEPRRLAGELAEQHEMLLVTLRSIGDGVITTDANGEVVFLNPVAERLTGWTVAEAWGRPLADVFRIYNEDTREPVDNPVALCLAEGRVIGLANHTLLISRHGEEFGIEDSAAPIRNAQGDTLGVVLVFHDVTAQRRLTGEMSYRASHDMLTGLLNRPEFEVRLRFVLHKAHADLSQNALLFVDLDQFKQVNDACGHAGGDELLQQVARLLGEVVRASDTLARMGGDEFAVILDHCSIEQAQRLAQRICDRMEEFRFSFEHRRFQIGASVGLVPLDRRWPTTAAVLQAADAACYRAKELGRNRVHLWSENDRRPGFAPGETQWASRLARALEEDRFVLFAQRIEPLSESARGGGLRAEVLLRLLDSDGALALPGAFLPAAERFRMAGRIDRWVLRQAVGWIEATSDRLRIDRLGVNLSGQSLADRSFHAWVVELLARAGRKTSRILCLELSEAAAIANLSDTVALAEQVRAAGALVAVDDFGSAAVSFGYLRTLPGDVLKIDGQFARNLVGDPLDEAAVRCFVDVATAAGLQTVAECVERADVLHKLRLMGVDFAQGFAVHRPAPIDELLLPVRSEVS
jgi:diguanylate cyclase (GGDEF)-like protein/PAS domain S-box-containing protein